MKKLITLSFLLLLGTIGFSQVLQEGFEGSFPPAGWLVFDNGIGTSQAWQQNTPGNGSTNAAFVRYENVTSGTAEDWLVSPAITLGPNDTTLSFFQRQSFSPDWGSVYTIRISTDTAQSNTTAYTIIDTQTEPDFGLSYTPKTVSLASYTGMTVYIAFVMANDDGDNWYVDDVNVGPAPCVVSNASAGNITTTSADLSVTPTATDYEFELVLAGASPSGFGVSTPSNPWTANGLTPNTSYDFYVRSFCDSDERMMITGVFDGPLPGGNPKVVSLYVMDTIADLSKYGVSSANNGGGTTAPNPEFVFPAIPASPGQHIYISNDSASFITYFGFNADYVNNMAAINGDDAIELFKDSVVVDVFGDVNTDGTGTPWEYLDGWAYRKNGMLPDTGFTVSDWLYSGINATDGCTTNGSCISVYPVGTFMTTIRSSAWYGPVSFTTLCLPVTGDSISDPIMVSGTQFNDTSSTASCYTDQIGNASNDVFYMLIADPCATSLDVSLCGSSYDTYLRILDAQGSTINTNDDDCGTRSQILGQAINGGDTIFVVVEGYNSNNGDYVLSITQNLAAPVAAISYASSNYCQVGTEMAVIAGDSGGMFVSSPAGLVLDSLTGTVDLQNSAAGTYAIVYSVGPVGCVASDTSMITIDPADSIAVAYTSASYCLNDSNPTPMVSGSAVTFSAGAGLVINGSTGEIDLANSTSGSYIIMLNSNGACPSSDSIAITLNAAPDAFFSYSANDYCISGDTILPDSISSVVGGGFTSSPAGLALNATNGAIDLANTAAGLYDVTYTVIAGQCASSHTAAITINAIDQASVAYSSNAYCTIETDPVPTVTGATGTFSSPTGLVINASTGEIDLSASPADSNHVVLFTTSGPCPVTDTIDLIVSICISLEQGIASEGFSLFPVPNNGNFSIQNNGIAENANIEIISIDGRVVFNGENYFEASSKSNFSIGDVTSGIYFVRIKSETRMQTIKMVVEQ